MGITNYCRCLPIIFKVSCFFHNCVTPNTSNSTTKKYGIFTSGSENHYSKNMLDSNDFQDRHIYIKKSNDLKRNIDTLYYSKRKFGRDDSTLKLREKKIG